MPGILIRPWTDASPDTIPEAGGEVTFTVEARATGPVPARSRLTFELRPADGYRWENGALTIVRNADLGDRWRGIDFPLGLDQHTPSGARLLVVDVEGVLVSAAGQEISTTKRSSAKLTVEASLAALVATHRDARGQTQKELAQQVGVSPSWISALERGESPSVEVFDNLKGVIEE